LYGRTHAESQTRNSAIIHLHLHYQLAVADVENSDSTVKMCDTDDVDCGRLDEGSDRRGGGGGGVGEGVNERAVE
jgi:hypothetical protein